VFVPINCIRLNANAQTLLTDEVLILATFLYDMIFWFLQIPLIPPFLVYKYWASENAKLYGKWSVHAASPLECGIVSDVGV
jgi:hypothetical protein